MSEPLQDLRLTLVQSALVWDDAGANRDHFRALLEPLAGQTDLILLPETFSTGFSMDPKRLGEAPDGPTVQWMQSEANRTGAMLCGSLIINEGEHSYNRFFAVSPDGEIQSYNKRHLFTMGGEHKEFTAGMECVLWHYKGWKIRPQVCYDLRFPVWSRNTQGYDLLLYVANWPARRAHHWKALLRARAIENLSWVAAVNRIGEDGNGVAHSGDSSLIDPVGEILFENSGDACVQTMTLSGSRVAECRKKYAFLNDRDEFSIEL